MDDLSYIVLRLNEIGQKHQSPGALLQKVLPVIQSTLSDIEQVRVYRRVRGGLAIWGQATPSDDAPTETRVQPMSDMPSHQQAMMQEQLLWSDDKRQALMPLRTRADVFGLLEITFASQQPAQVNDSWMSATGHQLALMLEARQMYDLLQRQLRASASLNTASSFEQIAAVVASSMVEPGQYVSINLFEFDTHGNFKDGRVVATANRGASYAADEAIGVGYDDAKLLYEFTNGTPELLIEDVSTYEALTNTLRNWLAKFGIRSLYQVPLRAAGRTYGSISINDTRYAIFLTTAERQIYRNIADQVATTVQNQNLMRRMEASLSEARTLYSLNRDLIQSETIPDILFTIRRYIGTEAKSINLVDIQYDEHDAVEAFIVRYTIDANGNLSEPNENVLALMPADELTAAQQYWQSLGENLEIFEDMNAQPANLPLRDVRLQQGILSNITIPLMEDNKRRGQISIVWSEPRRFDETTRRLLRAIQAQVTIVLQNRRLITEIRASAQQSEQQVRYLRLLNDLATAASMEQNERALVAKAAQILVEATGCDHTGISIFDADGLQATIMGDYPDTGIMGYKIQIEGGIPSLLKEKRAPIVITSVDDDAILRNENRKIMQELGIKSAFFIPMYDLRRRLMGTVGLDYYVPMTRFDAQIISIAETIVTQLAVSLQKLRLLDNSQHQAAQMQLITTFSQSVQATLEKDEILQLAVESSTHILDFELMSIYLYDAATEQLRHVVHHQNKDTTIAQPGKPETADRNSVIWQAWQNRHLIKIADLNADSATVHHPQRGNLRTVLAAPMIAQQRLLGVVEIGGNTPFSPNDEAAFQQLVNQIAVALLNADTYSQSQRLAQNKDRAGEISVRLQQQMELDAMLDMTAREIGRMIGARRARIRLGTQPPTSPPNGDAS